AISAVVAYHLGFLGGGWYGVDLFFVLSGFLITSQLLERRGRPFGATLRRFWARRARRLLPGVLVLLGGVALYAWAGGPGVAAAQLRAPGLATLLYAANWQQIVAHHGYFGQFAAPNPLQHTWSLAIEEQFYLAWPIVVVVLATLARWSLRTLGALTAALAAVSAGWSVAVLHLWGLNRAYLGTDTRVWELLVGALAAMALLHAPAPRRPRLWGAGSLAAGIAVGAGIAVAGDRSPWIWNGGVEVLALCTAVVIVGTIRSPGGLLARALALGPLRWLGRISYSVYLWHWPVIVLMTSASTGLTGASLLAVRLAATTAAACASYYVVERPLRRADWGSWGRRALVPAGLAGTAALVLVATVAPVTASTAPVRIPVAADGGGAVAGLAAALGSVPTSGASGPVRVWLFGDSVLNDASPGVTAALRATGNAQVVADTTFPGWSFAHDPAWRSQWRQVIAQARPQVVIATWSWDDQLALDHRARYVAQLRSALDVIMRPGDGVDLLVLLQFPQVGPPASASPGGGPIPDSRAAWSEETKAQDAWDSAARTALDAYPGHALYLPTSSLFAPHGRYLTWFRTPSGAWLRARKIDNVHFCPYGAAVFGQYIVDRLRPILRLGPLAPGWEAGSWTRDPRYDDPVGSCPADSPPSGYSGVPVPS
ncbi:MAG TPA: acyltransferase, partial [Candidatus Dormibacteraeota bacterium]|nr:acyltransferase [Candidatus Dormibacteraeota bacterium]